MIRLRDLRQRKGRACSNFGLIAIALLASAYLVLKTSDWAVGSNDGVATRRSVEALRSDQPLLTSPTEFDSGVKPRIPQATALSLLSFASFEAAVNDSGLAKLNQDTVRVSIRQYPREAFTSLAAKILCSEERSKTAYFAAYAFSQLDIRERGPALSALGPLHTGAATDELYSELAQRLAISADPLGYELANKIDNPEERARVSGIVLGSWLTAKPEDARIIADQMNLSDRGVEIVEFFRIWTSSDPVSAADYINSIPYSENKDRIVRELVGNLINSDPENALIWAHSIGGDSRDESMLRVANATANPRGFVEKSSLPDADKKRILKLISKDEPRH